MRVERTDWDWHCLSWFSWLSAPLQLPECQMKRIKKPGWIDRVPQAVEGSFLHGRFDSISQPEGSSWSPRWFVFADV